MLDVLKLVSLANDKQHDKIKTLLERIKKDVVATDKKFPGFSSFLSHLNITKYSTNGRQPCEDVPQRLLDSEAYYLFLAEITNNGYTVWCINNWQGWTKARSSIKRAIRQTTKKGRQQTRIKALAGKITADIKKHMWATTVHVHVASYSPGAKYKGAPAEKIAEGAQHVCVYTTNRLWYVHNWKEWLASRKKITNVTKKATASVVALAAKQEATIAYSRLLLLADNYKMQSPSADIYPPGVTPKGKKIWEFILTNPRHQRVIFDTDDIEKQWKLALMIFRKTAWDRQIQPYQKEAQFLKTIVRRATRNHDRMEKVVRGDIATLTKAGLVARPIAAKRPDDVGFEQQHFFASAVRTFKLIKGVVPEEVFDELQKRRKYLPETDNRSIGKEVASTAYVMFWAPGGLQKGNTVELYTYLYLTRDEVVGLIGGQARYMNIKNLLPALRVINKRWIKTGDLSKSRGQLRVI